MRHYITCYNPGMETRKHIADIYRQGVQKMEEAARETQEFHDQWGEARARIEKVASEADEGLREAGSEWHISTRPENGGIGIWLSWSRDDHRAGRHVTFEPVVDERKVRWKSSQDAVDANNCEPSKLSETLIGQKVGQLVSTMIHDEVVRRRKGD